MADPVPATAACDGSPACPAEDHTPGCRREPPGSLDGYAWWPDDPLEASVNDW